MTRTPRASGRDPCQSAIWALASNCCHATRPDEARRRPGTRTTDVWRDTASARGPPMCGEAAPDADHRRVVRAEARACSGSWPLRALRPDGLEVLGCTVLSARANVVASTLAYCSGYAAFTLSYWPSQNASERPMAFSHRRDCDSCAPSDAPPANGVRANRASLPCS